MILIADSGSSKTDWCIIKSTTEHYSYKTDGINPFLQDKKSITNLIKEKLMPQIGTFKIDSVFFYGAGCTKEKSVVVRDVLIDIFGKEIRIEVNSDLQGAAIALCGNKPGIACILGTGSNSCEYDGKEITRHISPLGFILGDEGGGAYLGKRFIGDCIKGQLPKEIYDEFLNKYHLTETEIINKVYREELPNRFLATFTHYIYDKRGEQSIHKLLTDCFGEFFKRNVLGYDRCKEVNFIGSVAYYFESEIKEAAIPYNIRIGKIIKAPIDGLIRYYSESLINK